MRNTVRKAFTLVEILIVVVILGILAAIVVPQFTSASEDAQIGNVETQLQTIRQQIELFRVRHNGDYPGIGGYSGELSAGALEDWGDFETNGDLSMVSPDYLRSAPLNPRTGTVTVALENATAAAVPVASGDDGWWYNPEADAGEPIFGCRGFRESGAGVKAGWIKVGEDEPEPEVP